VIRRRFVRALLVLPVLLVATPAAAAHAPRLASPAALVVDVSTGQDVLAQRADDERPIGSMTKIFVAMVLRKHALDLTAYTEITEDDASSATGGARTRLPVGESFANLDLLRAMLMVSDNEAPTALARSIGLDRDQLITEMNQVATDLGLAHTHFTDCTGIDGNVSTPREIARALEVTLDDPLLAAIMRTRKRRVVSKDKKIKVDYRSTVQPLHDANYRIYGGKTGHTSTAGYCMMIEVEIAGRDYVMAFLGGDAKQERFEDFDKVAGWLVGASG
jgi:D-alanyl-D-alanine endopeptidase (penicillin-binding protein 7)